MSSRQSTERAASILVGVLVIGLVGWMTLEAPSSRPAAPKPPADAGAAGANAPDAGADASAPESAAVAAPDLDGGLSLTLSLDAAAVLPAGAPRSVKIGVVLVAFAGAEGAPASARSKAAAREMAERLAADAKADFHRAVTGGDPGSADDIGRLQRGILDARTEVAVFGLEPGEVSNVLETARGFWIVKRID